MTPLPTTHPDHTMTSCPAYGVDNVMYAVDRAVEGKAFVTKGSDRRLALVRAEGITEAEFEPTRIELDQQRLADVTGLGFPDRLAFLAVALIGLTKWDKDTRQDLADLVIRAGMDHHGYRIKKNSGATPLVVNEPFKMFALHPDAASLGRLLERAYERVPSRITLSA